MLASCVLQRRCAKPGGWAIWWAGLQGHAGCDAESGDGRAQFGSGVAPAKRFRQRVVSQRTSHKTPHLAVWALWDINCPQFRETLEESEIFGHERGASRARRERRIGCSKWPDGWNAVLDEIGKCPAQHKR